MKYNSLIYLVSKLNYFFQTCSHFFGTPSTIDSQPICQSNALYTMLWVIWDAVRITVSQDTEKQFGYSDKLPRQAPPPNLVKTILRNSDLYEEREN